MDRSTSCWMRGTVRAAALAVAAVIPGVPAAAQADSATLVPSLRYQAGSFHRFLLGSGYRDLWATPVHVEVLSLDAFAGGLTPLRAGGARQTRTLHLRGADGRRYVFRSVEKFVRQALPEDLQRTPVESLLQDQMSALHPTGALAVPPLARAAGVLQAEPRLVVMPDDPRLGEHREVFAGMLGQIEEWMDEGEEPEEGAVRFVSMERLLERLEEDPANRLDAPAYLAARLLDFLVGDTDRGLDQWRWAGEPQPDGGYLWAPVPRDRDYAFVRGGGVLVRLASGIYPKLAEFGPDPPPLHALVHGSVEQDRRLLAWLPREVFDSVAAALQARITDEAIERAAAALPPEQAAREGPGLAAALRARREHLRAQAGAFHAALSGEVDLYGTDEAERAEVEIHADGSVEVRLGGGSAALRRRFRPGETREVRLYLAAGDDTAVVRGAAATPIRVRVVGGEGDDVLVDSSGGPVSLHDDEGRNVLQGRRVDRRSFAPPELPEDFVARKVVRDRYRDWGSSGGLSPVIRYRGDVGVLLGARLGLTQYGFRRVPHAWKRWVEASYAPAAGGAALEAAFDHRAQSSPWGATLRLLASQVEPIRFHGFGNDSPEPARHDDALALQDRLRLTSALRYERRGGDRVALGVRADYTDPDPPSAPAWRSGTLGTGALGSLAAWAEAAVDRRSGDAPRWTGWSLSAAALGAPGVWDLPGAYGTVQGEGRAYLTAGPTLALRGGGSRAWGEFPLQEAPFVGGDGTLRGYRERRFAGDAALYGTAELRQPLGRIPLVVRGLLGAFAFADAGRVYLDGASPGGWHTGLGGGFWFASLGSTLTATVARGEETRVYLKLGVSP